MDEASGRAAGALVRAAGAVARAAGRAAGVYAATVIAAPFVAACTGVDEAPKAARPRAAEPPGVAVPALRGALAETRGAPSRLLRRT